MKEKLSFAERLKRAGSRGDFASVLMLLPAVFLLVVISIYPFCWLFRYIFYDYNGFTAYYIGFKNFTRMFQDAVFWRSVLHTFEYAVMKLVIIIPLSLLLAVLLNQKIKGSGIFRGIYFMPTVISSAVYSLIFGFIFAVYNGVLNAYLQKLGMIHAPIDWLGSASIVMISIIIVAVWGGFGNYMILFMSGLSSISEEVYESCKMDGANGVQSFFYITLPMLSPVLKVILMLAITTALKDYESILVLTNGGPNSRSEVMFTYIYKLIFGSQTTPQIGYATVLSIVAALIIGVITAIYMNFARKLDDVV
ncbi:carbohydrate ABC transporter permease [Lacrimispora saccharolytica]|uniref:Binding-protein-dependent transport systems inner membrane component n=1 Tax=Lacrimispora saccharolytica (strain ATCC 35040 / DSM 2544 / NRCC 2533 / WM1) TaxID=610130 RepID=D9RAI6_LACSW|nr:sugar ABC transporter permease [Lacrimispora saccharolytica]ADL04264.1 binding-protein-dependent transport systems inner membrane component [[Clostridium] saccharolyticum WM1]QRV21457.1 sugar ABC transporter permease [Lacrimispora saccharolytica]